MRNTCSTSFFWSSTENKATVYTLDLYRDDAAALVDNSFGYDGYSVRCIKD